MNTANVQSLRRVSQPDLAYVQGGGCGPALVWLPGFAGDMGGQKAQRLAQAARQRGRAFVLFDYRGCGASQGRFEDGAIGVWLEDALAVIDQLTTGPLVLVGSSMGGWIALLAALARPERVRGLTLVAPAPDFTERLLRPALSPEAQAELARDGRWLRPSAYGAPTPITTRLLDDGRRHLVLGGPIAFSGPVRILHGVRDADVPWTLSLELAQALTSRDVELTLIKDGDHRLSEPQQLDLLAQTVFALPVDPLPPARQAGA